MKPRHKPKTAKKAPPSSAKTSGQSASRKAAWQQAGICVFLAAIVWVVFGQTARFEFVNMDDNIYVYQNPAVTSGLTLPGVATAFDYHVIDNWVPLTTLSHMAAWQLFGSNPAGHHLTNVVLHAATAILLFLVLCRMTAALWRSAFVAALFAIHPLRAESVAWVSERKDVLCGVFFMLTLWAYVGYARNPRSLARYLVALVFFAFALMAKPIAVTLPVILLLLDYWPLNRFASSTNTEGKAATSPNPSLKRLLLEKIPFLLLSLGSCLPTVLSERPGIMDIQKFPLPLRIENALVSCAAYIWQLVWPAKLIIPYPYPSHDLPFSEVTLAVIFLATVSLAAFYWRRKYPYLLVSWVWYLVMLVPVIGLVQVGVQARADRHTYLSEIGLCLALAWWIADLSIRWRNRLLILGIASALIIAALTGTAVTQVAYWHDDETMLHHTLAITPNNWWAHVNLGDAIYERNQLDDAMIEYRKGIEQNPDSAVAHSDLGDVLLRKVQVDDAIAEYRAALKIDPGYASAHSNLGYALIQKGDFDQAIAECREALKLDPHNAAAYNNLGDALYEKNQPEEAMTQFREALKLSPGNASYLANIGDILAKEGRTDEAVAQYAEALKSDPANVPVQDRLGRAISKLAMSGTDPGKLLTLARQANQVSGGNSPYLLRILGAAEAASGQYADALATAQQALNLADGTQSSQFIERLQHEIAVYQSAVSAHPAAPPTSTNGP